jgi:hypothetical protein
MKNLLFTLLVIFLAYAPSNAQEVSKKQWTLLHERTADWCPFCGTWGWDFKGKLITEFADKPVVFAAIHHSGGLANAVSEALGDNFPGSGQPRFYVDGTDLLVNSSNQTTRLTEAKDIVDYNKNQAPYAGIGINATAISGQSKVNIDATVEVLEKIEDGDYYLGLYILEDIIASQASRTSSELHKNVLTGSVFTETFGKSVFKGLSEKGSTYKFSAVISEDYTAKLDKVSILGVLWNKRNNTYMFFNGVEVPLKLQSSTINTDLDKSMSAFANEAGDINVQVNANAAVENVSLQLSDIKGSIISTTSIGTLPLGYSTYRIANNGAKGTYFVSIVAGQTVTTKTVIIP